jgi:hypothetical protein
MREAFGAPPSAAGEATAEKRARDDIARAYKE